MEGLDSQNMLKETTDTNIENIKEEMIGEILRLVRYDSVTGNKVAIDACLSHFLDHAEELGFRTMTTSERDVGIVEMGQGDETVGILVHLDVVSIGDREKWTDDPFQGILRDGYLWGRGTEDDKGGAVMSLYAMKAVQELGLPMRRKVWLIVGTSEESKWTDIASFKREFSTPCCGFSPDGRFPIFNVEKGYADIVLNFYRDGKRGIQKLQGGDSPNTIPSKAKIILQDGRSVTVHGVATHSSVPKEGDNAVLKLCHKLEAMEGNGFDFSLSSPDSWQTTAEQRTLQIDDDIDVLHGEYIGLTTIVPTIIALERDHVRLTINVRNKFGTTKEDILNAFAAHAYEYGYEVTVLDYLEPMMVSRELPFLNTLVEVSDEYGVDSNFRYAPGTSYAKSMKNFVSMGTGITG